MKNLAALIVWLVSVSTIFSADTNTIVQTNFKIGEYIKLPDPSGRAQGFLQYTGQHDGTTIYVLSSDIGSGMPSEDLRIYAKDGDNFRPLLNLPMLHLKGYRCVGEDDFLKIFVTASLAEYETFGKIPNKNKPLMVIDLSQLIDLPTTQIRRPAQAASIPTSN